MIDNQFIQEIKERLAHRYQVLSSGIKNHLTHEGREVPQDFADAASHKEEESLLSHEDSMGEAEIDLIEAALQRIENGKYGICAACSTQIPLERLRLVPHTLHCVSCQEKKEGHKRL